MSEVSFRALGASAAVVQALAARKIVTPFPIQTLVLPDALDGVDMLAESPTGSGKTLAFGVPIVERTARDAARPAVLVLVPTRELASQVAEELEAVGRRQGPPRRRRLRRRAARAAGETRARAPTSSSPRRAASRI